MPVSKHAAERFFELIRQRAAHMNQRLSEPDGEWIVRGVIDVYRNIYPILYDTKALSKIIEIILFPNLQDFTKENNYQIVFAPHQNYYPDLTFIDKKEHKFALDIKSTYRISKHEVSRMTLGVFDGYFRKRDSHKNITFPYKEYSGHFVLGIIYTRKSLPSDLPHIYPIEQLNNIPAVISDLLLFVQPKYKIASDKPGSGNTKNIGSVSKIQDLIEGKGPFAELGEEVFDDYWMGYMTADMARAAALERPPYTDLASYLAYKRGGGS
jgi:hypothetical protein